MKITSLCIAMVAVLAVTVGAAHADPLSLANHVFSLAPGDLAVAMGMMVPLNARARGLYGVRADTDNATAILAELQKTFEAFKTEREEELKGIKANLADVVKTEKVDRINAEITKLQAALDETNAMLAAVKVGGGGGDKPLSAEKKAHAAAFNNYFRHGVDAGLSQLEVKASLKTDSDPDGGFVAPDQIEMAIDRVLGTVSAMRGIARVMSISGGTYKKVVNLGGATSGWVGERESRTETNTPVLSELSFPAMELYAMPGTTQRALDDIRFDAGAWLADEVSIEFAEEEGAAFIAGDGVNKPRGLLSYTAIADASYAWGKIGYTVSGVAAAMSDSTHSGLDALVSLVYALKQGYRSNARFLMNRNTQAIVRKLVSLGDEKLPLWQPSMQLGQPATLLGYPITDDDNMSDVGANAYPIAFGDFNRAYLIVDRAGIRILRDPYTSKGNVLFYTTKRVGGGVQNFEAVKLLKVATS